MTSCAHISLCEDYIRYDKRLRLNMSSSQSIICILHHLINAKCIFNRFAITMYPVNNVWKTNLLAWAVSPESPTPTFLKFLQEKEEQTKEEMRRKDAKQQ